MILKFKVDDQKIVWGKCIDNSIYKCKRFGKKATVFRRLLIKASTTALTVNEPISVSTV